MNTPTRNRSAYEYHHDISKTQKPIEKIDNNTTLETKQNIHIKTEGRIATGCLRKKSNVRSDRNIICVDLRALGNDT